jgi:hypothetical protein
MYPDTAVTTPTWEKKVSLMMKTTKETTPRERCPILTQVPVGFLAVIAALMVIAVIVVAAGMTVHGFHTIERGGKLRHVLGEHVTACVLNPVNPGCG